MDNYRNHPALSQSELKATHYGNEVKMKDEDLRFHSEKRHFILGDGVDVKITQPEAFEDIFYVDTIEDKPTDKMMNYLHALHERFEGRPLQEDEELKIVAQEIGYLANMSVEKIYGRIEPHIPYYNSISESNGKQILSVEELEIIDTIVQSFKEHEIIGEHFKENWEEEIQYQLPLFFKLEVNGHSIECKGLLDMVKFDHKNKIIYPYDIKTMGDYTYRFMKSFKQRRYDIQAAWYTMALLYNYEGYTIKPFTFIVDSTKEPGNPCMFEVADSAMDIALSGRQELVLHGCQLKPKVDGIHQMLDSYIFYKENGKQVHIDLAKNNFKLPIQDTIW